MSSKLFNYIIGNFCKQTSQIYFCLDKTDVKKTKNKCFLNINSLTV